MSFRKIKHSLLNFIWCIQKTVWKKKNLVSILGQGPSKFGPKKLPEQITPENSEFFRPTRPYFILLLLHHFQSHQALGLCRERERERIWSENSLIFFRRWGSNRWGWRRWYTLYHPSNRRWCLVYGRIFPVRSITRSPRTGSAPLFSSPLSSASTRKSLFPYLVQDAVHNFYLFVLAFIFLSECWILRLKIYFEVWKLNVRLYFISEYHISLLKECYLDIFAYSKNNYI